jgi:hypothetical protein
VFHYIRFPDPRAAASDREGAPPGLDGCAARRGGRALLRLRRVAGLRKKPSTSELLDWLMVLARAGVDVETLKRTDPFLGVLLKQESDLAAAKRATA